MTASILIVAFGCGETNRAYYFASRGLSRDGGFHSFINGREDDFRLPCLKSRRHLKTSSSFLRARAPAFPALAGLNRQGDLPSGQSHFRCVMRVRVISWTVRGGQRLDPRGHTKPHGKKPAGTVNGENPALLGEAGF